MQEFLPWQTTTVEISEGYRALDGGEVSVLGYDPGHEHTQLKSHIGIVLQSTAVEQYLTVAETLTMYGQMFPHPRPVDEVIGLVGLADKQDARVIQLSGGTQRRLDMAIALTGVAITAAFGWAFYGAEIPRGTHASLGRSRSASP